MALVEIQSEGSLGLEALTSVRAKNDESVSYLTEESRLGVNVCIGLSWARVQVMSGTDGRTAPVETDSAAPVGCAPG